MAATAAKLPTSTAITTTPSSPPSSSSSPSHEFSFTISFHPSAPSSTAPKSLVKGSKSSPAIDLSPADDIFFHGHLLPLHLLSRPPPLISQRLSNADNLCLPTPPAPATNTATSATTTTTSIDQIPNTNSGISSSTTISGGGGGGAEGKEVKSRTSSKSSSFTSLFGRRRKEEEEDKSKKKENKKKKFDVMSRVLKKYATMVEALLFSRGARQKRDLSRRPYSFSGNSNWKGREEWIERRRKRWGQFSAPASMRTSPTNSGLLVATTNYASSEESTMEELQNAIQAAIAHCKNSIAMKEKEKPEKEKDIKDKEEEEDIPEKEKYCS